MQDFEKAPFKTDEATRLRPLLFRVGDHYVHAGTEFSSREAGDWEHHKNPESTHAGLVRARELFEELTDVYQIKHVEFMPVIGEVKGRAGEYVVTGHIKGEPSVDAAKQAIPSDQLPAVRTLLGKLTNYAEAKSSQKDDALTDIFKLTQYVYDRESDEMVLVDVDPYYERGFVATPAYKYLDPVARQAIGAESTEYKEWQGRMESLRIQDAASVSFDEEF